MEHRGLRTGDHRQSLVVAVPPTAEPVSLSQFKEHSRITRSDEDLFLTTLLTRARQYVERLMSLTIAPTTYELRRDRFPNHSAQVARFDGWARADAIVLPRPPLLAVDQVLYLDVNGVSTILPVTDYTVDQFSVPASIVPAFDLDWPETRQHVNDVTIRYEAGYDGITHVRPESIDQAILMLAAHWHENREGLLLGVPSKAIEFGLESLVNLNRVREFA